MKLISGCFVLFLSYVLPVMASDIQEDGKEQISVTAHGAPSSFVNHVNTIFGNLLFACEDIPAVGPHSVPLVRYYNSQLAKCGWIHGAGMTSNYPLWIRGGPVSEGNEYAYAIAEEDGGSVVCCVSKFHEKDMSFYLDPETIHKGLTNTSGEICAQTNLKNTHFRTKGRWNDSSRGMCLESSWTSQLSNGGEREYFSNKNFEHPTNIKGERKPDMTELSFDYRGSCHRGLLKEISSQAHNHVFGWLKVDYHKHNVAVSSSNGKAVRYDFKDHHEDKRGSHRFLEKVETTDRPTVQYDYDEIHGCRLLTKISHPDGRYLKILYDDKGRVTEQKAPVNPDGSEKTVFTFFYHPSEKNTEVYDAAGRKTVYKYSSRDRLTHIDWFENTGPKTDKGTPRSLYRGEQLVWGGRESIHRGERDDSDEGHLLAKTIYDGNHKVHSCERYHYDDYGNIIQEALYGNLSGSCTKLFSVLDDGHPDSTVDAYHKHLAYSKDKFHLKIAQSEDYGPRIGYEYKPGTNLLSARLTYWGGLLKIREFFEYDDEGVLIKKIIDNGVSRHVSDFFGVTERKVDYIIPVRGRENPGVGLPEQVTECYTDLGAARDVQLRRTRYLYTKAGLVAREDIYDANDCHRYSLTTQYDNKNRPISRTDPIGRERRFEYDANGNITRSELIGSGVVTTFSYDRANRLSQKIESHDDGPAFVTSYTYDTVGNLLSETNPFGQTTTYVYDSMNREKQTIQPAVPDKNGVLIAPAISKGYDLLDNVSATTDANGNTTKTAYTIRNKPFRIDYPDGSSEVFSYNMDGTLAKKRERNGSTKVFWYDLFRRLGSTEFYDANGAYLCSTHSAYNAFHCTSSTDKMGIITSFSYDPAGRLLCTQKAQSKTQYSYDALGRRETTTEFLEQGFSISTIEQRDLLDRVVETKRVHSDGTLLSLKRFVYDIRGNCTDGTSFSSPEVSTTVHTDFSTYNVPIQITDALGNRTQISYDYGWTNEFNQRVLRKVTTDPLGSQTIETFDTHSRLDTVEKRAADSTLLAKTTLRYDAKGNKVQEKDYVVVDGAVVREYGIEWAYTAMDQVSSLTEQPQTADEKATRYTYTKGGLVETFRKPDGVVITHSYDALNRIVDQSSSDGTVHYTYTYDLHDNPVAVVDQVLQVTVTKSFDDLNHVTSEDLWPGLNVAYAYDFIGRCTRYSINGVPSVDYQYQHGRLSDVIRDDPSGSELYRHQYVFVDLEEKVVESALIGSLGSCVYGFDGMGRTASITTPFWQEAVPADGYDAAGNLHAVTVQDGVGSLSYHYSYDNLYQLVQEEGASPGSYAYDSIFNRLKKNGTDAQISPLNQVLSDASSTYVYDKNGNLIELVDGDFHLTFSYDALDRLRAVEQPNLFRTEYFYDASHRRLRKQKFSWENGSWQPADDFRFLYLGSREVGSCDAYGAIGEFRVLGRGKGAELGASVAVELGGVAYCPINDHRGNIVTLVDLSSQQPFETYRYTAFGEEQVFDSSNAPATACSPWRFASKRTDPETGLVFFGRRYYSSQMGRFVTPDPVGFPDGPNLYAYVHNSPMVLVDPYGLSIGFSFCNGRITFNSRRATEDSLLSGVPKDIAGIIRGPMPFELYDRITLEDGQEVRRDEDYGTGLFVYPDGDRFLEKSRKNLKRSVTWDTGGMNTSKFEMCQSAQRTMDISRQQIKHVVCRYQNTPINLRGVMAAIGAVSVGTNNATGTLQNETVDFLDKCHERKILFQGMNAAQSLGVSTSEAIRQSPELQVPSRQQYFGRSVNFGGPIRPIDAFNYEASTDVVPYLGVALRSVLGGEDGEWAAAMGKAIVIDTPGFRPDEAHAFFGVPYQWALYDAIYNKGALNE